MPLFLCPTVRLLSRIMFDHLVDIEMDISLKTRLREIPVKETKGALYINNIIVTLKRLEGTSDQRQLSLVLKKLQWRPDTLPLNVGGLCFLHP